MIRPSFPLGPSFSANCATRRPCPAWSLAGEFRTRCDIRRVDRVHVFLHQVAILRGASSHTYSARCRSRNIRRCLYICSRCISRSSLRQRDRDCLSSEAYKAPSHWRRGQTQKAVDVGFSRDRHSCAVGGVATDAQAADAKLAKHRDQRADCPGGNSAGRLRWPA